VWHIVRVADGRFEQVRSPKALIGYCEYNMKIIVSSMAWLLIRRENQDEHTIGA